MSSDNKLRIWHLSHRAKVYPHLELDNRPYSQLEMRELCNKLAKSLPNLKFTIYEQSSYCNELNGPWNVCFSVKNPEEKGGFYTYIIRRCVDLNKTFGCPFFNNQYVHDLNTFALSKVCNEKLFTEIENKLISLCPNVQKVDYFDT